MQPIIIKPVGDHPTVAYAAEELCRVLGTMTGRPTCCVQSSSFSLQPSDTPGIWLGTAACLPAAGVPPTDDPHADAIAIAVSDSEGFVAGSNPRSVLLAAYRYLTALGCRWVRPGPDGEYIPTGVADLFCEIRETPSYGHRGVCIEGAVSEQHVINMIEWLPRTGMNAYFTQFRESYTFFHRWYSRSEPDRGEFTVEDARHAMERVVAEVRKRSLLYHAVGHGWTCDPFGMPGLGWEFEPVPAPPEAKQYLALVGGKREVWGGVPLNTNLCYSNPEVRRIMVADMVQYAQEHPDVDLLHVWLADGSNNQCECSDCSEARPSDFYVILLNELDEALSAHSLATRVVFLIYVDLLWPPERERILNPDRFVLMFAPITRSYSTPFAPSAPETPVQTPPYVRNRLEFPRTPEANVAFLRAWEAAFTGDGFDFDYHLMWDHYNDPGYCRTAPILHEDARRLTDLGLNGLVSCQTQRASMPTGLMMFAMAQALWDRSRTYGAVEEDYFRSAFGPDWPKARGYLSELSEAFDPERIRGDRTRPLSAGQNVHCDTPSGFERVAELIESFAPVIAQNEALSTPAWAASWRYLRHHADLCGPLAQAYAAREQGDTDEARRHWQTVEQLAWEREPDVHSVLDVYLFANTLAPRFAS